MQGRKYRVARGGRRVPPPPVSNPSTLLPAVGKIHTIRYSKNDNFQPIKVIKVVSFIEFLVLAHSERMLRSYSVLAGERKVEKVEKSAFLFSNGHK